MLKASLITDPLDLLERFFGKQAFVEAAHIHVGIVLRGDFTGDFFVVLNSTPIADV